VFDETNNQPQDMKQRIDNPKDFLIGLIEDGILDPSEAAQAFLLALSDDAARTIIDEYELNPRTEESFRDHPQALLASLARGCFNTAGIRSAEPHVSLQFRLAGAALLTTLDFETTQTLPDLNLRLGRSLIGNGAYQNRMLGLKAAFLDAITGQPVTLNDEQDRAPVQYVLARLGGDFDRIQN
jgi:hypothetical protein